MELRILESLAALFLFLSIARPLIRGLWKLPGLTICPLLALGIIIGIFPAYGFRPECTPLLLFALFLVFVNLSDFLALFSSLQSDSYRDRGLLFTLCSAAVFAFAFWITINFAPPLDTELSTEGIKTVFLMGGEIQVRIYQPEEAPKPEKQPFETDMESLMPEDLDRGFQTAFGHPLLVLLPPEAGSITVSDEVCIGLRDRGFTVLTYSRVNFDSPFIDPDGKPERLNFFSFLRLGNALTRGLSDTSANTDGRKQEETRKQDTIFLLRELSENKTLQDLLEDTDKNMTFLVGYGSAGAALTVLAGQDDFSAVYPQVRGIIAIEAPLFSSLEGDPPPPPLPPAPDPISTFFQQIGEYINSLMPKSITHITKTPSPGLPILFILSDRVISERSGRYETILKTLESSRNAALLAAVRGAGPFDYSASPKHYPIYSFLFRGAEPLEKDHNWPLLTASLITNFAILVLENETVSDDIITDPDTSVDKIPLNIPLIKTALDNNIHLEQRGVWQIPDVRTILHP